VNKLELCFYYVLYSVRCNAIRRDFLYRRLLAEYTGFFCNKAYICSITVIFTPTFQSVFTNTKTLAKLKKTVKCTFL